MVVITEKIDNYITEARKAGITVKKFTYDIEKYNKELEQK